MLSLQMPAQLAILHHGHGTVPGLRDVGSSEPLGQNGGRRGEEVPRGPGPLSGGKSEGKGKGRKGKGRTRTCQWRVHTRHKQPAAGPEQVGAKARRHSTAPGHGDGLLCFFERGTRVNPASNDDPDNQLASDTSKREDTSIENTGLEIQNC